MKNLFKVLFIAILFSVPFYSTAQQDVLTECDDQGGGGGGTPTTYFNSNINKVVGNVMVVKFQTQDGVNQPLNLQVLPYAYGPEAHLGGYTVTSFTRLSNMHELKLEVIVHLDNTESCPPNELCYAFFTYKYTVTIKTNGTYTYTAVEI